MGRGGEGRDEGREREREMGEVRERNGGREREMREVTERERWGEGQTF